QKRDEVEELNKELRAAQAELRSTLYASQMNLAQHAWDRGRLSRVLDLLGQQRPKEGASDLRNFEWHYLDRLCHSEDLTLEVNCASALPADRLVAFSPDGKRLAVASFVKLKEKRTFGEKEVEVTHERKTVKVCDAQTGKELLIVKGNTGSVG